MSLVSYGHGAGVGSPVLRSGVARPEERPVVSRRGCAGGGGEDIVGQDRPVQLALAAGLF